MALLRGYRPRSGLEAIGTTLQREGARWQGIRRAEEQKKLTAQENNEKALADAKEMQGSALGMSFITEGVANNAPEMADKKSYDKWYDETFWPANEKAISDVVTTPEGKQNLTNNLIVEKERYKAIFNAHYEQQSVAKENAIFSERAEQQQENINYVNEDHLNEHISIYESYVNDAHGGQRVGRVRAEIQRDDEKKEAYIKNISDYILQHPDKIELSQPPAEDKVLKDYYLDHPNEIAERVVENDKLFGPDNIADLKKASQTAKNYTERKLKAKRDLQARTIEKDIYKLQSSDNPEDNRKALDLYNSPEAQSLLSTSVLRTLNNGFNNTKTYTPEEKATAHTEGIETMVAFRAGRIKQSDAKSKIDKLRSSGAIDAEDGEDWTEELLGFKKSPSTKSGTATAMDLGIESIKKIKRLKSKVLESGEGTYKTGEVIEGENILREVAKSDAYFNQQIIDAEAYFNANPDKTPTEVNKYFESINAPAKDELAKDIVTRKWYEGLGSGAAPLFGGPGRDRLNPKTKEKSPYKEYPAAFQEDGSWYVMKDGKRYRIKD